MTGGGYKCEGFVESVKRTRNTDRAKCTEHRTAAKINANNDNQVLSLG